MCWLQRAGSQGRRTRWSVLQVARHTQWLRLNLAAHEDLVPETGTEISHRRTLLCTFLPFSIQRLIKTRGTMPGQLLVVSRHLSPPHISWFGSASSFSPLSLLVKHVKHSLRWGAHACSVLLCVFFFNFISWETPAFENLLHAFCCVQTQSRPCLYT